MVERVNNCDAYSGKYRATYYGKLTEISHQNGVLMARFGVSFFTAKIETLPEWIREGCEIEIELSNEGIKISPFSIYEKEAQAPQPKEAKGV